MNEPPILDRHAHPDVGRPWPFASELDHAFVPLRQDLERVMLSPNHDIEHVADEVVGDLFLKQTRSSS